MDRDRRTEPAHERCARAWMRLRTGHRGGRVIEHYDGDVMLVVNRIGHAGHPRSEERGITHERDRFLIRLDHIEALRHRDARAHVETGIDCIERRSIAKRVAADITAHHRFAPATERLLHGIERTAMRASCTQDCGAVGYRVAEFDRALSGSRKIETEEFLDLRTDRIDRVFATRGSGTRELALYLESRMQLAAEFEQFVFDHMIELFEHDDAIEVFGEFCHGRLGEGIGSAHLHKTIAWRKRTGCFYRIFDLSKSFFGVGIRYATCDDADLRAFIGAGDFAPRIERRSTEICCDLG